MYLFGVLKETYWRMFHPMTVPVGAGAVFIILQKSIRIVSGNIPVLS